MKLESDFLFTICQVGAEPALKKEIAREYPDFRFAFSRPGFVTFKHSQGAVPFNLHLRSVFARAYGNSYGSFDSEQVSRVIELAETLVTPDKNRKVRLQVWERDQYLPGDEPLGYVAGKWIGDIEARIRRLDSNQIIQDSGLPEVGDWVIQVIALDPGKFALGLILHSHHHSQFPGARPPIQLPQAAPSRAYLKLEESLLWSRAPIKAGDTAVEIGSSPGGASYALLQRGVKVIGIDPAVMDPVVAKHPNFVHVQMSVNSVLREDLPESVQWLLLDMNVEPNISMYALDRLAGRMKESLYGVILTIKLNQWKIADEIPYFMDHVKAMGMVRVKAAQLSYHRQEFQIFGLTRRGMTRVS